MLGAIRCRTRSWTKSQALIEGKPTADGRFVADHVQGEIAPSKYEAAAGRPETRIPYEKPKTRADRYDSTQLNVDSPVVGCC